MNCCGFIALTVETIYVTMDALERKGLVCPCACATARDKLLRLDLRATRLMGPAAQGKPAIRKEALVG